MTKSAFGQKTPFGGAGQTRQQWGIQVWFSESQSPTSHGDIATVITLEDAPSFGWYVPETYLALEDRLAVAEGLSVVGLVIAPPPPAPPMDWFVGDRDPAAEAPPSPVPQLAFVEFPIAPPPLLPLDWFVMADPGVLGQEITVSQLAYVLAYVDVGVTAIAPPISTQAV